MERLKLDQESLGLSSLMEKMMGVRVKDCFRHEETIYIVVASGEAGKAIGKEGMNIHRVQAKVGKKVKIIEYNDDISAFVNNVIHPLKVDEILTVGENIIIKEPSKKTKSLLIGREGRNLKLVNRAVQRFFNKEVKVV